MIKIGDVEFSTICIVSDTKEKHEIVHDCDCANCLMGWESRGYEGECEDYGCYFDYNFNVPLWKCMLPDWIKKILLKRWKAW